MRESRKVRGRLVRVRLGRRPLPDELVSTVSSYGEQLERVRKRTGVDAAERGEEEEEAGDKLLPRLPFRIRVEGCPSQCQYILLASFTKRRAPSLPSGGCSSCPTSSRTVVERVEAARDGAVDAWSSVDSSMLVLDISARTSEWEESKQDERVKLSETGVRQSGDQSELSESASGHVPAECRFEQCE